MEEDETVIITVRPEIRWKHGGKHSIEYTVYQVNIDGICIPNKDKDAYYTEDEHEAVNQAFNNYKELRNG